MVGDHLFEEGPIEIGCRAQSLQAGTEAGHSHAHSAAQLLGAVAVLLGAMGMVSVGKAVFIDHLALNCACVGGNSKTPLGVVSFAENLIMAAMGAVMLAGR